MDLDLAQKAVSSALSGDWKNAVSLNLQILRTNSKDTDALNRLARAKAELGNIKEAKALAEKVLKIDPFNTIAAKSLKRWRGIKNGGLLPTKSMIPEDFLEEPGRTKIVSLLHLGDPKILAKLDAGDIVELDSHSHRVCVLTQDGKYIGRLTDDLSAKLRNLIKLGNKYHVLIKSNDPEEVKVFIRETHRNPKLKAIPSFQPEKIDYISYTPPELVHKKDEETIHLEEE